MFDEGDACTELEVPENPRRDAGCLAEGGALEFKGAVDDFQYVSNLPPKSNLGLLKGVMMQMSKET